MHKKHQHNSVNGSLVCAILLCLAPNVMSAETSKSDKELISCSQIAEPQKRLACFDRLATKVSSRLTRAQSTATDKVEQTTETIAKSPVSTANAHTISPVARDRSPAQHTHPASAKASGQAEQTMPHSVPPSTATEAESQFGIENRRDPDELIEKIYAKVVKVNESRFRDTTYELDNDQIWVKEDNRRLRIRKGDQIYIERGVLGAFYMGKSDQNMRIKVDRRD